MATANELVGSVYEVGIEGQGYMLAESPARPVRRSTGILDSQPPGSTAPLAERIGRYDHVAQADWTGGEGQAMADRPSSDATRYYYSEGLDPFTTPGQITNLPLMENFNADTQTLPYVVTIGSDIYVRTSNTELTQLNSLPDASPTTFTATGGGATMVDLATDGVSWYTAFSSAIRRNSTAVDPAADWSTVNATRIAWIGDRIAALTADTPPAFTTLDTTGVEESAGGWVTHPDATLTGVCGGDGYAWWGVRPGGSSDSAHIHHWQVDSSPVNHGVSLALPPGEYTHRMFFYLGNVFVMTNNLKAGTMRIYRCVHSGDGKLTPQLVQEIESSAPVPFGGFAGVGKLVAFGWHNMQRTGENGIGVIDLETGGVARWHATASTSTSEGVFPARYGEDFILACGGTNGGLFGADDTGDYRTGFLETSTSDLATPALKHLDEISVSTAPLPTSGGAASVAAAYSIDNGANFTTLATYNTAGDTRHSTELSTAVVTPSLRLRATLTPTGDASDAPTVTALLAKTHATGIVDEIIELPISCEDTIAGVHGTVIAEDSGPNKGMERYRTLEALIGTKVLFQDVDWKETGDTSLVEVVGIESTHVQVFNQNRNLSDVAGHVAVVQLRRPYTA